jgi:hypothetical protein
MLLAKVSSHSIHPIFASDYYLSLAHWRQQQTRRRSAMFPRRETSILLPPGGPFLTCALRPDSNTQRNSQSFNTLKYVRVVPRPVPTSCQQNSRPQTNKKHVSFKYQRNAHCEGVELHVIYSNMFRTRLSPSSGSLDKNTINILRTSIQDVYVAAPNLQPNSVRWTFINSHKLRYRNTSRSKKS